MKSKIAENKDKKPICEEMYIRMEKSLDEIADVMSVNIKTLQRWRADGEWENKKNETINLEKQIEQNLKEAINAGLREIAKDPKNTDIQSLNSMLKQYKDNHKPTITYKENMLRFIDKTVDFLLEKNMTETANVFKSCAVELAEYIMGKGK